MRLAPALCALLVVLAGCGAVTDAPADTSTDTPATDEGTPSPTPRIQTAVQSAYGDELPLDPTPVFARVLNLTDQRVSAPVVHVEEPDADSPTIFDRSTSEFRTALGVVPPERSGNGSGPQLGAYTPSDGKTVHVYEAVLRNETAAEATLAHEFVHTVQFRTPWASEVLTQQHTAGGDLSHDGRLTYYMVLEGAASYVEHHYREQFLPNAPVSESFGQRAYENASAHSRLTLARYVLGGQYVADTAASPADLRSLHTDPPVSSEQVLHRTDDPVASLSVDANDVGPWEQAWDRDRQGELFVRIALRTELNRSTAADAAAGWGNDVRVTYERGNRSATAWILRWDDATNATEFESAFERYLDAKATRDDGVWVQNDGNATYRVERVSAESVAVFLGDESFVRAANASSEDGWVMVENESAA